MLFSITKETIQLVVSKTIFQVANVRSEGTSGQQVSAGTVPGKLGRMVLLSIPLSLSRVYCQNAKHKDRERRITFNIVLFIKRWLTWERDLVKCVVWVNCEVDFEMELGVQRVYWRQKEGNASEWWRRDKGRTGKESFHTAFQIWHPQKEKRK